MKFLKTSLNIYYKNLVKSNSNFRPTTGLSNVQNKPSVKNFNVLIDKNIHLNNSNFSRFIQTSYISSTSTKKNQVNQKEDLISKQKKLDIEKTDSKIKQVIQPTSTSFLSKQRPNKKKNKSLSIGSFVPSFKVNAYATADYYNLDSLKTSIINSKAYEIIPISKEGKNDPDNCLCVKPKYQEVNEIEPRHIFFFENGSVVFWNVSTQEQYSLLEMIEKHEENPYPIEFINDESEEMSFSRMKQVTDNLNDLQKKEEDTELSKLIKFNDLHLDNTSTRFANNVIYFSDNKHHLLEKYAFSDAIALSVKLGIWEKNLDRFTEKIEYITEDMRCGRKLKIKIEEVLKLLGELFTMRHVVNLHSDFLDTPDFYWDREHLEQLYIQLYTNLSISKRTKLFNERLNHCVDLMEILKQHLSDNKHTRLEWIIIGLITIEVLTALGILDFLKQLSLNTLKLIKSSIS